MTFDNDNFQVINYYQSKDEKIRCSEETKKEILKNQDDALKWQEHDKEYCDLKQWRKHNKELESKVKALEEENESHLKYIIELNEQHKKITEPLQFQLQQYKEKIGVTLADLHISNERVTNQSYEIQEYKEAIEKIKVFANELYMGGDNGCAELAKENQTELKTILESIGGGK